MDGRDERAWRSLGGAEGGREHERGAEYEKDRAKSHPVCIGAGPPAQSPPGGPQEILRPARAVRP